MIRTIAVACALAAATGAAQAQTTDAGKASETGVTLGARLAYGIPFGDAARSLAMSDYAARSVPVVVEAGYRFTRTLSASAYFQYAYASGGSSICTDIPPAARTSGSACSSSSGRVLRYGVEGAFRIPLQGMTPWVGLGLGVEDSELTSTVHIPASPSNTKAFNGDVGVGHSTALIGEVNVQGGLEWPIARRLTVGPFATVSFARYAQVTFSPNAWALPDTIPSSDRTWHEWLFLGAKGTFDL